MAKFSKTNVKTNTKTVNLAGGEAYSQSADLELVLYKEDYLGEK